MEYLNRAMTALRDINVGGRYIRKGESFTATPIDAGYFASRKQAAFVEVSPAAETAPAIPEPVIAVAASVAADTPESEPGPAPVTRRRGPAAKTTSTRGRAR